jgi:glycosyltransferase involved in cell wall biosynthesis
MKILHFIGYLSVEKGGPVFSLKSLAESQRKLGYDVKIAHTSNNSDGNVLKFSDDIKIINLISFSPLRIPLNFISKIFKNGYRPDIIHIHGLWYDFVRMAFNYGCRCNIPIILSPCGMLQEGALKHSSTKKRIILKSYLLKILKYPKLIIHSKSISEKLQIKHLLPNSNVKVVSNPVEICSKSFLKDDHKNQFIFLGRLHPVKGIGNLIFNWKKIYDKNKTWELLLIGPDSDGYKDRLIQEFDLDNQYCNIKFIDSVHGKEKWEYLSSAKYFVMPSEFENFGSAIVEGMSAKLPIITTDQTPWSLIVDVGCGWIISKNKKLDDILTSAINLDELKRKEMGDRARSLSHDYSTDNVIKGMMNLYESAIRKV